MGIFFVYILKTSLCLAVYYLFYRLLLSKETFHRFNRIALLGLLVFSGVVPFVEVTMQEAPQVSQTFLSLEDMMVPVEEHLDVLDETPKRFPWNALAFLVYALGILFFLVRHLWSLGRMIRLLRTSRKERMEGGITLFVHKEKVAPFSWMKVIAVSEGDLAENGKAILTHERAHIHNRHSWDLLLAEACVFLQWFNPAAWLLKQELQTIHEYEADEWVIRNGIDAKTYQLLIIKKAVGARLYSIANSFNHSSLKKRITMMIKKKSNPWARLKYFYVLPLAAVAVAAFARPEVSDKLDEISDTKINELVSVVKAIGVENEDSVSKNHWFPAVPVTEADTIERLVINLEVGQKPLFVIDGVPFGTYLSLDDINAAMVESATLLDKTEAMKLYGEKAKDGALVITSKHPEKTKVHKDVKFTQGVPPSDEKFTLNGSVMDHKSLKPIVGASVVVRGTTNGTISDVDGKFKLPVKMGDVIEVSYVGLQHEIVSVNSKRDLVVYMEDDVQGMQELTVTIDPSKAAEGPKLEHTVSVYEVRIEDMEKPSEAPQKEGEMIFQVVEEMPQFPGGMQEALNFLGTHVRYPVAAQEAKIEGRVIVGFVVGKDGSVSDIKVVRGINPELDAEAVRVVSMMPKWIPGKQRGKAVAVKYTMPIMFRLQNPTPEKKETASFQQTNLKVDKDASQKDVEAVKSYLRDGYEELQMNLNDESVEQLPSGGIRYKNKSSVTMRVEDGKYPLIIIDGKEVGRGTDLLKNVPVDQIESISVMKNEAAIAQYGDKAKDGVISIATKKNKK